MRSWSFLRKYQKGLRGGTHNKNKEVWKTAVASISKQEVFQMERQTLMK